MDPKELLGRFYDEVWVKQNVDAIDEFMAPDFVDHTDPPASGSARDALKLVAGVFRDSCTEVSLKLDSVLADGDDAAAFWTMEWTQHGNFFGMPADGERLMLQGAHFYRIRNGELSEIWHAEDYVRLYGSLGFTPKS